MIEVYNNPWFSILKKDGFHFLKEKGSDNGAIILAKVEDKFLFVNIYRHAHESLLLELPRGYGELNDSSRLTALRELQEETGYTINESQAQLLGQVKPNSSLLCSNIPVYFINIEVERGSDKRLMDDEVKDIALLTDKQVLSQINSGGISDGMTLSALMMYFAKYRLL